MEEELPIPALYIDGEPRSEVAEETERTHGQAGLSVEASRGRRPPVLNGGEVAEKGTLLRGWVSGGAFPADSSLSRGYSGRIRRVHAVAHRVVRLQSNQPNA